MKTMSKLFTTILTLSAATLLTACGASKQVGALESSSRIIDTTTTGAKPLAYCNQATGTEINAKLKAYTDSSNTVRMDYVYVRMTSLPANFKSDSTYISMWKWLSNTAGNTYLDSSALKFILVNASNGQALTGWKNTLRWSDVSSIASGMGIEDAQAFFDKVSILVELKDAQGEYDVLKITNYDMTTNKSLSQTDALLPMFYANPADYAKESSGADRAQVLQGLHPFKNYANQGFTSAQFQSMAANLCF
jgi:hypothetical protein